MKVSTSQPFQIIYSIYQHEFLGFLVETFVVQMDAKGRLTLQHQNISSKNADEFSTGLDKEDFKLISLCDEIQQDAVIRHFTTKKVVPYDFFVKTFDKDKGDETLQEQIKYYLENRMGTIFDLLRAGNKMIFEMGKDGEPTWKQVFFAEEKASVWFHFKRNEEGTLYYPTIKYKEGLLDFQYKNALVLCNRPALLLLNDSIYTFAKDVDGNKLKPFLHKRNIEVPRKVEKAYYEKFVAPLIASFDVVATGFEIRNESYEPKPVLTFSELPSVKKPLSLFAGMDDETPDYDEEDDKVVFKLAFKYGDFTYDVENLQPCSVTLKQLEDNYVFHRVNRDPELEKQELAMLEQLGASLRNGRITMEKSRAFGWLERNREVLEARGYRILQNAKDNRRYFLGQRSINLEVAENNDWFDVHAIVRFGEFEIPFIKLRDIILSRKKEFTLPNGEIAVIPDEWFAHYSELLGFLEEDGEGLRLKKHHLALVNELGEESLARVTMSRKLEKLREFSEIEDYPLPLGFKGTLRPYQKAGYNWMHFLNKYGFGGCLADDMGLGKTVQTLAMMQWQKENGATQATLLVVPTSLVYNWENEARKFAPQIKVFTHTGTFRDKRVDHFGQYDLIITTYGTCRIDADLLKTYYFNYIILDESQAIKNPSSQIAKEIVKLNSRHKLILTGTPIENSTMDLWTQMSFINPGLLGSQSFFKNEFLNPIEKKHDETKTKKLYTIIKPFILRRQKKQVAGDLPDKVENIQFCEMTEAQSSKYEETKSYFRNKILEQIDAKGIANSQILLLQGLTILRQMANHPLMVEPEYEGDSGKFGDVIANVENACAEKHKILIFSQFVKHLSLFRKHFDETGIRYCYLDGTTKDRQAQVDEFQNNPEIQVFLISLKAGGVGLNLTAADYVFILDPWWNPASENQAIDRAHRIGQKNTVFTYKYITKDSVEEKILHLQQNKLRLANDLITTEESFIKNLTREDISELLK